MNSFEQFTSELRDVEAKTIALEHQYEELFRELGVTLFNHALDHDTATATMSFLYEYTDHVLKELCNSKFNKQTLACKAGCAHCCHLDVYCPAQVILYIADYIREQFSEDQIHSLLEKLDSYTAIKATIGDGKNPPCPFLNTDKQCEIYAARPITCRAFTSPDVNMCRKFIEIRSPEIKSIPQHSLIYRVHEMATTALQAAALRSNRDKAQVRFIPALAQALRNANLEDDWKAGKPFPP